MTDFQDVATASAAVKDATTSAQDLMTIAYAHPALGAQVARHPKAYPGLLDWLQQYGTPEAKQAVAARAVPTPPDGLVAQTAATASATLTPSVPDQPAPPSAIIPAAPPRSAMATGRGLRCGVCGALLMRKQGEAAKACPDCGTFNQVPLEYIGVPVHALGAGAPVNTSGIVPPLTPSMTSVYPAAQQNNRGYAGVQTMPKRNNLVFVVSILFIIGGSIDTLSALVLPNYTYFFGTYSRAAFVVSSLLAGALLLVVGITGVRNASDPDKGGLLFNLGVAQLIMVLLVNLIDLAGGRYSPYMIVTLITSLVLPILYLVGANQMKQQA